MGILRLFRKKDISTINRRMDHFTLSTIKHLSIIKNDIDLQKRWVDYLHRFQQRLQKEHDSHKSVTKSDLKQLSRLIVRMENSQKNHEKDIILLQNSVSELAGIVNKAVSLMEKRIAKLEDTGNDDEILKKVDKKLKEYAASVKSDLDDHHKKMDEVLDKSMRYADDLVSSHRSHTQKAIDDYVKKAEIMVDERIKKISSGIAHTAPQVQQVFSAAHSLTNPERKLLNLLIEQSDPITYSRIAQMTGNSINTVRVVMNSLKKLNLIEENTLPSGEKLFSAKNKEKIKKIYNISHM